MLVRSPLRLSRPCRLRLQLCSREGIFYPQWPHRQVHLLSHEPPATEQPTNVLLATHWRTKRQQARWENHRTFLSETAQTILTPPLVFVGLMVTLWTYKCIMMVLFQDKIIYMPGMPPFSRSEKMEDYTKECKPVQWETRHIKSLDGTKIALCIGRIPQKKHESVDAAVMVQNKTKDVVICYFQGNGSSTPPRLPILSSVLKLLQANTAETLGQIRYTLVALSYRGYWTSSGRASQSGIELDAQALLQHVSTLTATPDADIEVVLWGQSVGAGVATTAAARYNAQWKPDQPVITGLVLETPFSGITSMLIALYPQKWLPYRYLWPFLWNHWDSEAALRRLSSTEKRPKVLLLPGTRDEVVPAEEAGKLEEICKDLGFEYERKDVIGALHHETTIRRDGQQAIARFIFDIINK